MTANKDLVEFILEAKRRGFKDKEIIQPLLKEGWKKSQINQAYEEISPKEEEVSLTIHIDYPVYKVLEKRAKKNLLSIEKQVEDIVRRSAVKTSKYRSPESIDDLLISIFSRRASKKKKVK